MAAGCGPTQPFYFHTDPCSMNKTVLRMRALQFVPIIKYAEIKNSVRIFSFECWPRVDPLQSHHVTSRKYGRSTLLFVSSFVIWHDPKTPEGFLISRFLLITACKIRGRYSTP